MKNNFIRICLIYLLLPLSLHAQLSLDWALTQGSPDSDLTGSCKIDDQGGIYTTVVFRDSTDLDPGPEENWVNVLDDEIFVINKYTQEGDYVWSGQFITIGDAYGLIAEILNNRIMLVVYYTDTLTYLHDTPWAMAHPGHNIALISLTLDGEIISFQHLVNSHDIYFSDFTSQDDGAMLACGSFEGAVTFNTADSTKTLVSIGDYDSFIVRFNHHLETEWLTVLASYGADFAENIFIREDGRIYFAVVHDSTLFLQTNHGQVISPADGEDNAIFGWLASDGTIEQVYLFGGALGDQIRSIAADESGHMYISGYFEGEVNFQHPDNTPDIYTSINDGDGFVAKYTPEGTLLWARIFPNEDYGGVYTMRLHRGTHLYLSGSYKGRSDLDPGPDSMIVESGPQPDLFACKLDTDGNLHWVYTFGGIGFKGIRNMIPSPDGKLFLQGYYGNTLDCDPGPNQYEFVSKGGSDVFLIAFTEAGVITGSKEMPAMSMTIYPNPAGDHLEISIDSPIERVDIYTLNGTRMLLSEGNNQYTFSVNTNDFPPGLYMMRVLSLGQYATQPFLKVE